MVIDTVWGAVAVLPFDWRRTGDALLGITFLLGLAAFLLDLWRRGRIVIFLPILILLRGFAESHAGSPAKVGWQFRGNELLIAAWVLLQLSKLQSRERAPEPTSSRLSQGG